MTSPTNEQQRVDVLLIVRAAAGVAADNNSPGMARNLREAADAVAELIEALSECVIDMEATEEFYGDHPRAQEVITKAKAALASVGAAK